jgi:hypothetical protein
MIPLGLEKANFIVWYDTFGKANSLARQNRKV